MPIYEYACTACGERTEARQSFTDPPLEICEVCGGVLRKLYSPVGIVFKGSGFYSTDGKSSSKPPKKADKDAGSETKTEPSKSSSDSSKSGSTSSSSKKESSTK
jgi:putative FmdB family regulatory protein